MASRGKARITSATPQIPVIDATNPMYDSNPLAFGLWFDLLKEAIFVDNPSWRHFFEKGTILIKGKTLVTSIEHLVIARDKIDTNVYNIDKPSPTAPVTAYYNLVGQPAADAAIDAAKLVGFDDLASKRFALGPDEIDLLDQSDTSAASRSLYG